MTRITSRWILALSLLIGSAAFAIVAGLPSPVVRAAPTIPASFFGTVTVAGSQAAGGLVIEARIGGVNYAFAPETPSSPPTTADDGTYGRLTNVFHSRFLIYRVEQSISNNRLIIHNQYSNIVHIFMALI